MENDYIGSLLKDIGNQPNGFKFGDPGYSNAIWNQTLNDTMKFETSPFVSSDIGKDLPFKLDLGENDTGFFEGFSWGDGMDLGKLGLGLYQLMQGDDRNDEIARNNQRVFDMGRFNSVNFANDYNAKEDNFQQQVAISQARTPVDQQIKRSTNRAMSFDEWKNSNKQSKV